MLSGKNTPISQQQQQQILITTPEPLSLGRIKHKREQGIYLIPQKHVPDYGHDNNGKSMEMEHNDDGCFLHNSFGGDIRVTIALSWGHWVK